MSQAANSHRTVSDETLKLQADIPREELRSLNAIETWGATLVFSAIALVSKQIVDWEASSVNVTFHAPIFILPAAIGLAAFIFLRFVNLRIRRTRNWLYSLARLVTQPRKQAPGVVGWLMAVMPLLFGYGASWYLVIGRPDAQLLLWWLFSIAIVSAVIALVAFCAVDDTNEQNPGGVSSLRPLA